MTTFNSNNRRSLDGPIRRRDTVPVQPVAEPEQANDEITDEAVLPSPLESEPVASQPAMTPIEPIEPVFVYEKPKKKVRSAGIRAVRWIALVILTVVLAAGAWFGYKGLSAAHNIIGKSNGVAPALAGALDLTKLKGEGDGRVNILVLGIGGEGHEAPNLSDTIMVMSIDPKTKDAAMLSIPRDLYVKIPASSKTQSQYGKINAANAYGGPELAARVVSNVIGVPIHYYVLIDFSGFKQAIDAVGGVDINVPKAIYDPDYPCDNERGGYCAFKMAAGPQHMSGTVALRYSRSRKSTSDFDRAARQQAVIGALRQKALQLSTLTNPVKLTGLIDAMGNHVKTDIQPKEITKLAGLAKDIDPTKTPSKVLDTDSKDALLVGGTGIIDGAGYIEVPKLGNFNYTDIQDMVKNIFADHYVTDENALVEVQNGSGISGAAGGLVKSLQSAHYNVGDATNADDLFAKTVIYDYSGGKKPYTLNYLEQRLKVKAQRMTAPTPAVDANGTAVPVPQIRIILGSDYKAGKTSQ
jgi:LCP family protein required for cell wall assembly